jgi:hypothetical protein
MRSEKELAVLEFCHQYGGHTWPHPLTSSYPPETRHQHYRDAPECDRGSESRKACALARMLNLATSANDRGLI